MVKSFARTIKVTEDPALRAELREHLRTVWPEVLGALKDAGVLKSKIFLSGSRLFAYFECVDEFDGESGFDSWVYTDEKCIEWNQLMQRYEEPVGEADQSAGEWWKDMEEVYCFETQHELQCYEPAHANAVSYDNSYMY